VGAPRGDHGLDASHVVAFTLDRLGRASQHRRVMNAIERAVLTAKR
jgi:hypothetical protein